MRTPAPRNPRMNSADSVQRSTGLLTVDGLSYAYTDAVRGAQTAALKNISFSVARGVCIHSGTIWMR
jgi:ABC-type glutathione transport system ATPase component